MSYTSASYQQRKRTVLAALALIGCILVVTVLLPRAKAWEFEDILDVEFWLGDWLNGLSITVKKLKQQLSEPFMERVLLVFGKGGIISKLGGEDAVLLSSLKGIFKGLAAVTFMWNFLLKLGNEMLRSEMNLEWYGRWCLYAILSMVAIANSDLIIGVLERAGSSLISIGLAKVGSSAPLIEGTSLEEWIDKAFDIESLKTALASITYVDLAATALAPLLKNVSFTALVFTCIYMAWKAILANVIAVAIHIPLIAVDIALYSIWIEISIRKITLPVSLASVFVDGARSPGVAQVVKLLAQYIRVVLCGVIAVLGQSLLIGLFGVLEFGNLGEAIISIISVLAVYMAVGKLMTQTSNITYQSMGV